MQTISLFIDDSGVFHNNEEYFIYAGYIFLDNESKDNAKREYRSLLKEIDSELVLGKEYKATALEVKHKRALYNVLRKYHSFGLCVANNEVYDNIMSDSKSRNRYKDYALKRAIKNKVIDLISKGLINPDEKIRFNISIDEQGTATNGLYSFSESIKEEFNNGIINFNYGMIHKPILNVECDVTTHYCDSSNNYLIQAADILANRLWVSYIHDNRKLRKVPNHRCLHLP